MKLLALSISIAALLAASPVYAACTTSTTVTPQQASDAFTAGTTLPGVTTCDDQPGPKGDKGEKGDTGAASTVAGPAGKDGQSIKGDTGAAGRDGTNGRNGRDYDLGESLALSSAMSMPVWLGDNETVRITGGVGFSDEGDTAFGATAAVRLDKNWALVGGAAVSDQGTASGRIGASVGW